MQRDRGAARSPGTRANSREVDASEAPAALRPSGPHRLRPEGWLHSIRRVVQRVERDNVGLIAAGVAFWAMLSVVPALAAAVSIYGLWANPDNLFRVIDALQGTVPAAFHGLLTDQLSRIAAGSDGVLTAGAALGLAISVWSANRATKSLFTGLNIAYAQEESRSIMMFNLVSLATTLGAVLLLSVAVAAITVFPVQSLLPGAGELVRYGCLATAMLASLAVLYRTGPDRRSPRWQWVSVGSLVATLLWLVASAGFSAYVERFADYNQTFGTLGGVAISMTWLWITAFVVLLGAELNAEIEHETLADSTRGSDRPLGDRGAFMADDVPSEVAETYHAHRRREESPR